jgi:hemoglobin
MLPDITNRNDIITLVNAFYETVKKDNLIGPIFTEKVQVQWEKHLPVMYDFWENIIFYSGGYSGNPMALHQQLHQRVPLTKEDFERWLKIFKETTDSLFAGDNAEMIKQRAQSIATVMQIKILHNNPLLPS